MLSRTADFSSLNKVSVIGLGYIGLPTAAVLASRKMKVIGVDVNRDVVATISCGEIHIKEPELDILVHASVKEGYLQATLQPEPADVFLITVPTPIKGEDKQPDLSYIESAATSIAPVLKSGDLVILESTSPVGTTEKLSQWLASSRPDLTFPHSHQDDSNIRIAYCPERVLPGHIIRELVQNDRVIGGLTTKCSEAAKAFYKTFVEGECIITNARTAEMVKLTENSFRDVNIAFANELSMICDKQNINVWELIQLANRHPRVNILQPGPGVGGHCIAVDPWFIVSENPEVSHLIRTAREVNVAKPQWVVEKVKQAVADYLMENPDKTAKDVTIACYGLTFKADIDDLRESPSLMIVKALSKELDVKEILVTDPNITTLPEDAKDLVLINLERAVSQATIGVLLVKHKEFRVFEAQKNSKNMLVFS